MFAILEDRYIETGWTSPIGDLVEIANANHQIIYSSRQKLGDDVEEVQSFEDMAKPQLDEEGRMNLCDRIVGSEPDRRDVVIWLRIKDAHLPSEDSVAYGPITLYEGKGLAYMVTDPTALATAYSITPVELLDDEVQKFRAEQEADEYFGFPYEPLVVYARISLVDIPVHRAEKEARSLLKAVLDLTYPDENQWNIMGGHLQFASGTFFYRNLEWGRREPIKSKLFIENDHTFAKLKNMTDSPKTINQQSIEDAQPILKLINAVLKTKDDDLESVIMASVRSVEHVKSWVVGEGPSWSSFINNYLMGATLKLRLRHTIGQYLYVAAANPPGHYPPDRKVVESWRKIIDEVRSSDRSYNIVKIHDHVDELIKIQAETVFARPLRDLQLILKDTAALKSQLEYDRTRVGALAQRLRRSRNAAVHGGVLSQDACESMANFAFDLALQALNVSMKSIFEGVDKKSLFDSYRDESTNLLDSFSDTLDLSVLFEDTASRKTKKVNTPR
ncbi:hypothetical protein SAMN02799641_02868 [Rhodococcus erythropolis]|nr:hypothetical protein SAMN02799641_02868 [Rhodococcus erythropolis]